MRLNMHDTAENGGIDSIYAKAEWIDHGLKEDDQAELVSLRKQLIDSIDSDAIDHLKVTRKITALLAKEPYKKDHAIIRAEIQTAYKAYKSHNNNATSPAGETDVASFASAARNNGQALD